MQCATEHRQLFIATFQLVWPQEDASNNTVPHTFSLETLQDSSPISRLVLFSKIPNKVPVPALMRRVRPRKAVSSDGPVLSNHTIVGVVKSCIPCAQNGLADIVQAMVLMAIPCEARLVPLFVLDDDLA